jgi:hypothetical protein
MQLSAQHTACRLLSVRGAERPSTPQCSPLRSYTPFRAHGHHVAGAANGALIGAMPHASLWQKSASPRLSWRCWYIPCHTPLDVEEFGALQGARRGRVLVRAEGDGASQQDETTRREEARIAALEKLTRSGPEQKKRQQTAVKRQERKAAAPVRAFQGCACFMRADALGLVEAWHRVVLAQRTATMKA